MSGPKTRTNPFLVIIAIVLCLACGALFTRSSANPSPLDEDHMLDVVLAENTDPIPSDDTNKSVTVIDEPTVTPEPEPTILTPAPEPTEIPVKTSEEDNYTASPEASVGVWTPNGSNWLFLVDGQVHKGWLYDTDKKVYYFDDNGIMVTKWKNIGDKRYYFNLDGILQTGDIIYKEKTYHLLEDGSLEGYSVSEAAEKKKAKEAAEEENKKEKEETEAESKKEKEVTESEAKKEKEVTESEAKKEKEETEAESKKAKEETESKSKKEKKKTESEAKKEKNETVTEKKTIALTFDDGPSSFTDRLLDCLEENNVKATFFLVGYEIDSFPEEVKRMNELGMEIGNHTADHADLSTLNTEEIKNQIDTVNSQLNDLIGKGASVLRPPYGAVNDDVKANASLPLILWSIDTLDWESQDAEKIVETILNEVEDGSIILMHDIYSTTVDAVEILVPELLSQGYELVTVHELANTFNVTLENGVIYNSFKNKTE